MMHPPFAYLGPGSGFAFLGSFLTVLLSLVASFLSLLSWPFRMAWRIVRRGRTMRSAHVRRLIFLDVNGLDPDAVERLMAKGSLPNLARLKDQGSYRRFKGMSSIALPAPFWKILKRHAVDSTILRIPGALTANDFDGRRLFAASELRGISEGFSFFTTQAFTTKAQDTVCEGGKRYPLIEADGVLVGELRAREEPILFRVIDAANDPGLEIDGRFYPLKPREFTPWIRLKFGAARGIVRFLLTEAGSGFSLYATAVQMDPEKPGRPISQPRYYANYLAKLLGTFSLNDMPEAASALKSGVLDENDFLVLARLQLSEREAIFFSALEHQRNGVLACAFEISEQSAGDFDRLAGRTLNYAGSDSAVFVLSGGLLFCNQKIDTGDPRIEDLAPAALRLLGISLA